MAAEPEQDQPQEIVLEGPDPRDWAGQDIGRLLDDIEAIGRAQALRKTGSSVYGKTHDAVRVLLDRMMDAAQDQLAAELLITYKAPVPEDGTSPAALFESMGRPRAFGAPREDIVPAREGGQPAG